MGGDGFFRAFFIAVFIILFLAGAIMFFQLEQESQDKREISRFMNSRGKTEIPRSWRSQMGKGI